MAEEKEVAAQWERKTPRVRAWGGGGTPLHAVHHVVRGPCGQIPSFSVPPQTKPPFQLPSHHWPM